MKKILLIFSLLLSYSIHSRMNAIRSLSTAIRVKPLHAQIVDKAAGKIPRSKIMERALQERSHEETVIRASFLTDNEIEDLVLHIILHADNKGLSEARIERLEEFIRRFIYRSKKARYNNFKAFKKARSARNFWGRYYYDLYPIKT